MGSRTASKTRTEATRSSFRPRPAHLHGRGGGTGGTGSGSTNPLRMLEDSDVEEAIVASAARAARAETDGADSDGSDFGKEIVSEIKEDMADKALRSKGKRPRKKKGDFKSRAVKNEEEEGGGAVDEKSEALEKAMRWKKPKGRPPEVMSRRVHKQQVEVNPLLKMLNVQIYIKDSSSEGESLGEADTDGSSSGTKSRKRSKKGKRSKKPVGLQNDDDDATETSDVELQPIRTAAEKGKGRATNASSTDGVHVKTEDVTPALKHKVEEKGWSTPEEELSEGEVYKRRAAKRARVSVKKEDDVKRPTLTDLDFAELGDDVVIIPAKVAKIDAAQSPAFEVSQSLEPLRYPRQQTEARPNFELKDAVQAAIGPLVLSKPGRRIITGRTDKWDRGSEVWRQEKQAVQVPQGINRYLRSYQRQGIEFFFQHYAGGEGGVLGDDMGLGKTIQVIGFLSAIMHATGTTEDKHRRKKMVQASDKAPSSPTDWGPTCLVISPKSVVGNWAREIETWSYLEAAVLDTTNYRNILRRFNDGSFDILVTGLEFARGHIEELKDLDFSCIVVDEVHRVKDPRSQLAIAFRQFKSQVRFGLTGTAVQNDLAEMHTILDWARPEAVGTSRMWQAFVTDPLLAAQKNDATDETLAKGRARAQALVTSRLPKFFLRRTKDLIKDQLPKKVDRVVFCPLTATQIHAYRKLLACADVDIILTHDQPCPCGATDSDGLPYERGKCCEPDWPHLIFQYMTLFQKLANHLVLMYPNKEDKIKDPLKYTQDQKYIKLAFEEDWDRRQYSQAAEHDPELCGKWKVLDGLLAQWKAQGDKVLVFSRSVKLLNCLSHFCDFKYQNYVRLDGSTPDQDRLQIVDQFQNDPEVFVFLISTLAGGVGLNLTAANKVVVFDPNWNPSHDLQALDRAFRIGQTRDVDCFRLVSAGSVEELIYTRQVYKNQLSDVAYDAKSASRYFKGVQHDRMQQGELFGVKNIFRLQNEGAMAKQAIEQCNLSEIAQSLMVALESKSKVGKGKEDAPVKKRKRGGEPGSDDEDTGVRVGEEGTDVKALSDYMTGNKSFDSILKAQETERSGPIAEILRGAGVNSWHDHSDLLKETHAEKDLSRRAILDLAGAGHKIADKSQKAPNGVAGGAGGGGVWPPPRPSGSSSTTAATTASQIKSRLLPELKKAETEDEKKQRGLLKRTLQSLQQNGDDAGRQDAIERRLFGVTATEFARHWRLMDRPTQKQLIGDILDRLEKLEPQLH